MGIEEEGEGVDCMREEEEEEEEEGSMIGM